ncbi:MAG TPA: phage major tail tube protein [Burkholderiales bacterium]|nr:phage major tail tube protein [Burkholderiales bacterium]
MATLIPEKLNSFKVYLEGEELLGIANVTLPSIEAVTSTVKGAGIAGEYESPTVGHYKSIRLSIKWLTMTTGATILAKQQSHSLELHGSIQAFDIASRAYKYPAIKIRVNGTPTKFDMGKFESGSTMDSQVDLELTYIKLTRDGEEIYEIDKLNFISKVLGEDALAPIRAGLGMSGDNAIVESATNKLRSITGI